MGSRLVLALLTALLFCVGHAAEAAERRIALVIGESAYEGKPVETAANDAGLIAQTLQAAGFDVSGARDLDEESLRGSLRDFVEKARNVGPDGVAFIYFAGAGAQLEGDNYLLPVGAPIANDADIPLHGARLSDYLKPLASMGLKAAVIVLDAARALPYKIKGEPLAGGLALYEPGPSLLLAFNAAPGTLAPPEPGPYGVYAHALAEMIRAGGLPIAQVFDQTRLRVMEVTRGAQIPWNSQGFDTPFIFFERTSQAPPLGVDEASLRGKPIAQFSAQDAFAAAVARDTLQSYQDFLTAFPDDPLAQRVRAILAARREALFWRKTRILNTPAAYWTYVRVYPRGPHAWDARRLLAILASPPEPPPAFTPLDLGYPPPPPPEIVFVSRPVIFFGDPVWGFAPPPPPPPFFLLPPPPDFVVLPPPVIIGPAYVLPVPPFIPVAPYVQPPPFIAPPPPNFYFTNLHNPVVVDVNQNVVITSPQGRVLSTAPIVAGAVAGAAGVAIGASLPRFIANKAALAPTGANGPGGPAQPGQNFGRQGFGGPTQGQGLPPQGPGSAVQAPLQGSHNLPQPTGSQPPGQGSPVHVPGSQAQGQGQGQQPLLHGQGPATQGAGSAVQQPFQGSHALPLPTGNPPQGQGLAGHAPSSQAQGQGQGQQPLPHGQGTVTQGAGSALQQPSHTLPQPTGNPPQGQGLTGHAPGSQAQGQGQQPLPHGQGPATQGAGAAGQEPFQGSHALPHPSGIAPPGQGAATQSQSLTQPQGPGHHTQGRNSQTQSPPAAILPPPSMQPGGGGHPAHGSASQMQAPPLAPAPPPIQQDHAVHGRSGQPQSSGPIPMMQRSPGPGPMPMMQRPPGPPPQTMMQRPPPGPAPMQMRPPSPPPQMMMQRPPPQAMAPRPQPMMMQRQAPPPQAQRQPPAKQPPGQDHH